MIIWTIENEEAEFEIEIGSTTVLQRSHVEWYKLVP
jgi:hypothetical protein